MGSARPWGLALRDRWPIVLISVLVAVLAATLVGRLLPKRYEAQADVTVTPLSSSDATFVGMGLLHESGESRSVLTVARFIRSPEVARGVAGRIGGGPNGLLNDVQVIPQGQSQTVTVAAHAGSPGRAAKIANAFADTLIAQRTQVFQRALRAQIAELSRRLDALPPTASGAAAISDRLAALDQYIGQQDPTLQKTSPAVAPHHPVQPRMKLALVVAVLAALLLGVALVFGLELVDPRVREEQQVSRKRILVRLPRMSPGIARRFRGAGLLLPGEMLAGFRLLAQDLVEAVNDAFGEASIILVAGSRDERSKTVTAMGLAAFAASAGRRTVVVDADFRDPAAEAAFGLSAQGLDLSDLLAGADADEVVRVVPNSDGRLSVVPLTESGARRLASGAFEGFDLLGNAAWSRVCKVLRSRAEVVVVNAPSGVDAAQLAPLASNADAVLMTVELGVTSLKRFDALMTTLGEHDAKMAGIVLFTRERARPQSGHLPYRYLDPSFATVPAKTGLAKQPSLERDGAGSNLSFVDRVRPLLSDPPPVADPPVAHELQAAPEPQQAADAAGS